MLTETAKSNGNAIAARQLVNHNWNDISPRHTVLIREGYCIDFSCSGWLVISREQLDSYYECYVATVCDGWRCFDFEAHETDDPDVWKIDVGGETIIVEECEDAVCFSKQRMLEILGGAHPNALEYDALTRLFSRLQHYRPKNAVMIDGEVIPWPQERLKAALVGEKWVEPSTEVLAVSA